MINSCTPEKVNVLFSQSYFIMSVTEILSYLLFLLYALAAVQVGYYLLVFIRLALHTPAEAPVKKEDPVSVILCARNEVENLKQNLPLILEQDYRKFEVIVANDNSSDETTEYLAEMALQYPNLREVKYVENEKYPKGKKFILTLAIKAAKYDILLHTDADCAPASNQWLRRMQQHFTPTSHIVLGYAPYNRNAGMLNRWVRFETFYTALQYLSFALARMPYMGVGRNLSYRSSLFFAFKGFASHNHIMGGDDDLFVNETATNTNTQIEIHPEAFTYTQSKKTWGEWWRQKSRHLSTGRYYKTKFKWLLGTLNVTHILTLVLGITLLCFQETCIPAAIVLGFRTLVQYSVLGPVMKKLKCFSLWWGILLFDLLYVIYYIIIGTKTIFRRNKRW